MAERVRARTGSHNSRRPESTAPAWSEAGSATRSLTSFAAPPVRCGSARDKAAEIASVLAFSAIRNNDKVGLILFSDEIEKFIPPRKGRRHVLRVIREVLFFEPRRQGTDLNAALEFLMRVTPHKAIAAVISDFIAPPDSGRKRSAGRKPYSEGNKDASRSLAHASLTRLMCDRS